VIARAAAFLKKEFRQALTASKVAYDIDEWI
jgi:hypothetical protein